MCPTIFRRGLVPLHASLTSPTTAFGANGFGYQKCSVFSYQYAMTYFLYSCPGVFGATYGEGGGYKDPGCSLYRESLRHRLCGMSSLPPWFAAAYPLGMHMQAHAHAGTCTWIENMHVHACPFLAGSFVNNMPACLLSVSLSHQSVCWEAWSSLL